MDVRLGMPVRTRDGREIGKVDRLVVDPEKRELLEIVIHRGPFFTTDRIVDCGLVNALQIDDEVLLKISAREAEELPAFVEHEHIVGKQSGTVHRYAFVHGTPQPGQLLVRAPIQGYHHVTLPEYESLAMTAGWLEVRSDLPEEAVALDRGTDVFDREGRRIGTVREVLVDPDGAITGLTVALGLVRHHDVTLPPEWITAMTDNEVVLTVSEQEINERRAVVGT